MRKLGIVHPGLLATLDDFYPSTGTVQQSTPTQSASGELIDSWSDLAEHVDLPCRIVPATWRAGLEERLPEKTIVVETHTVALRGHYSDITEAMRFVSGGTVYNILRVEHDGQSATTRLKVELVR